MDRPLAHKLDGSERTADVALKEVAPFSQWLIKDALKKGLESAGFRIPTVIQASAIPIGKSGVDLIIRSKAGTGKTLIFSTILLENCLNSPGLHSLIVTPTREIAIQIEMVLKKIAQFSKKFRVIITIGGTDVALDRKKLQNASTVVGTPGRLMHLIQSDILKTSDIKLIVLDEADQLYSSSHRKNLEIILQAIPAQRQIIACSATFCNNLDQDLAKVMRNPLLISTKDQVTVLLGIKQYIYELPEVKTSVLEMEAKVKALVDIFRRVPFKLCMLFAGSQSRAETYSHYLADSGWECDLISGGQKQAKRSEIFEKFQSFRTRLLISTDLMARGIDSEHVNLVINIEPARDMVTYLHRIGRAGRFGSHGIAITLVCTQNDKNFTAKILGEIGCGMNVKTFPSTTVTEGKDENFWDPQTFKTELKQGNEKKEISPVAEENCSAVLRCKENVPGDNPTQVLPTEPASAADSTNASLDTKTFCIDSKDSAVNILPAITAENKENLLRAEDTPTSNRSSVQLSANTIDDASSITADSVFSSQLELNAPHPSLALDHTKNLNYCSFVSSELREAIRDEVLKTDLFMDYCANVLNDSEENDQNEIALDTKKESLDEFSKVEEEEDNSRRDVYDDMFADYTNFITAENDLKLKEQRNDLEETSHEKDVSLQVCLGSLDITAKESNDNDVLKENNVEAISNEGVTDSQSYLQETICGSNGSYSADCEPSMESKVEDQQDINLACEVALNSEPTPQNDAQSYLQETICASNGSYCADCEPSTESNIDEQDINLACKVDINPEQTPGKDDSQSYVEENICPSTDSYCADSKPSMESNIHEQDINLACKVDFNSEPTPGLDDSQSYVEENICASTDSYCADSKPSMESKIKDKPNVNVASGVDNLKPEPTPRKDEEEPEETDHEIYKEKELNPPTKEEKTEESDEEICDHKDEDFAINANINSQNKSKMYDIWMKEYWRQVNFMQFYMNFSSEYQKQCENN